MTRPISGDAAEDGTGLVVASGFNVGNISSSSLRWPRVFPRCATASTIGRHDMEAWLVGDDLTVVPRARRRHVWRVAR